MRISFTVNGEEREAEVWEGESLLYSLREHLGLPGSKNACEQGECWMESWCVLAWFWPRRRTGTRS